MIKKRITEYMYDKEMKKIFAKRWKAIDFKLANVKKQKYEKEIRKLASEIKEKLYPSLKNKNNGSSIFLKMCTDKNIVSLAINDIAKTYKTRGIDGYNINTYWRKYELLETIVESFKTNDLSEIAVSPFIYVEKYDEKNPNKKRYFGLHTLIDKVVSKIMFYFLMPYNDELVKDTFIYPMRYGKTFTDCARDVYREINGISGANYVLKTDIKNFYNSIDIMTLHNILPFNGDIIKNIIRADYIKLNRFNDMEMIPEDILEMLTNFDTDGIKRYYEKHEFEELRLVRVKYKNQKKIKGARLPKLSGSEIFYNIYMRKYGELDIFGIAKQSNIGLSLGSAVSALCANLLLINMQNYIDKKMKKSIYDSSKIIRFVDDIIVVSKDKKALELILRYIRNFLGTFGLNINNNKTYIKSIFDGFDFIGFNFKKVERISKYDLTSVIITPSNENINNLLVSIKKIIYDKCLSAKFKIEKINKRLFAFATHVNGTTCIDAFKFIDDEIIKMLVDYTKERLKNHKNKLENFLKDHTVVKNFIKIDKYSSVNDSSNLIYVDIETKNKEMIIRLSELEGINNVCINFDRNTINEITSIASGLLEVYKLSNSNVSMIRNLISRQNKICPICGEKLFNQDEKLYYKIKGKYFIAHLECLLNEIKKLKEYKLYKDRGYRLFGYARKFYEV